jgi:gas vesicle protein
MNPDTLQRPTPRTDRLLNNPPQSSGEALSTTEQVKQDVGTQVKQVADDLKAGGAEAVQAAKSAGSGFVHDQQEKIACRLDEYTEAVKAACESLKSDASNPLAGPAQTASRQLERAAGYLHQKDPSELLDDLGSFARKRPEIFFGTMFVAGLAAVRFLKASSKGSRQSNRSSTQFGGNSNMGHQPPAGASPVSAPLGSASQAPTTNPASKP